MRKVLGIIILVGFVVLFFQYGSSLFSSVGNTIGAVGAVLFGLVLLFSGSGSSSSSGNASNAPAAEKPADVPTPPQEAPQPAAEKPKVKICPNCQKVHPLDRVYCEECGALLRETEA